MKFVKILTILMISTLIVGMLLPGAAVLAAGTVPYPDVSDVMTDLNGLKVAGEKFDQANYPARYDLIGDVKQTVLGIYEHGFGDEDYCIYIYVYNPDSNPEHTYDDIYMGTVSTYFDSYESQPVRHTVSVNILDKSDDGRFLKLKVQEPSFSTALKGAKLRIYEIGFETWYSCWSTAAGPDGNYYKEVYTADCTSSGSYSFNDNGAQYYKSTEVITLDVNPSIYCTDLSPKGDYFHQAIYTSYFSIPNKYVTEFDALTGIKCEWEERHTKPLILVEDESLYRILSSMAADHDFDINMTYPAWDPRWGAIISEFYPYAPPFSSYFTELRGRYAINLSNGVMIRNDFNTLADFLIKEHIYGLDTVVLTEDLSKDVITTVGKYYDLNGNGRVDVSDPEATFFDTVDDGALKGKNEYDFTSEDILKIDSRFDDSWFDSFWKGIFYKDDIDEEAYIDPFYLLKSSDLDGYSSSVCNYDLYIGNVYWSDFYNFCKSEEEKGNQVVLFRFAKRDYYSAPGRYIDNDSYFFEIGSDNLRMSFGTAILGFDIISLSFSKDSAVFVFDVEADPVDFLPGSNVPNFPDTYRDSQNVIQWFEFIVQVIKVLLVVVLVVVVVVYCVKFYIWYKKMKK